MINAAESEIVRRVLQEFSEGHSPKAIARRLNTEGIPGPRGKLWRDTAIRGHRMRGTGLLNNELYIGRLVWNRLRYIKDPETGKRVSRLNDPSKWIITEVPELRIVGDELWKAVKQRQGEIEADPRVKAIKETKFWEKRRKKHLLTGLAFCDTCGGPLATVGRDYLACSAARKLGTCSHKQSIRRNVLEDAVLDLLRRRLMQPDAVAAFIKSFSEAANAEAGTAEVARTRLQSERDKAERKFNLFYDAIAEGIRTPGLQTRLEELEAQIAELDAKLSEPKPSPVRLHPNLSELYRSKVSDLAQALSDPSIRTGVLEIIRGLIERVTIQHERDGVRIELEGALTAMIGLVQNDKSRLAAAGSVKVVAGAGFEPATFRL